MPVYAAKLKYPVDLTDLYVVALTLPHKSAGQLLQPGVEMVVDTGKPDLHIIPADLISSLHAATRKPTSTQVGIHFAVRVTCFSFRVGERDWTVSRFRPQQLNAPTIAP